MGNHFSLADRIAIEERFGLLGALGFFRFSFECSSDALTRHVRLQSLRRELEGHGVTLRTELADGLPFTQGHKSQLQQVIVNLVHNSIEAMDTVSERSRVLLVKTDRHDSNAVIVVAEDSGAGIEAARLRDVYGLEGKAEEVRSWRNDSVKTRRRLETREILLKPPWR
jgi:light-regulated signal transduction histidine kinase (bacteriophytochrome)